jgi:hypothetical protein
VCSSLKKKRKGKKNNMSSIHHRDAVKLALRHAAISTFLGIR